MNPWMYVTGWTLIHFVWQGALVAIATAVALRIGGRRSPEARYAIACIGLAAMLLAPVLTAAALAAGSGLLSAREVLPTGSGSPLEVIWPQLAIGDSRPSHGGARTGFESLLPAVVWSWLAGVLLLMVRFSGGCWRVHCLRVASIGQPASSWQSAAERLASRLRVVVGFRVVESALVDAPTVIGWLRPIILLPVAVVTNLTPGQIEALVAHELAHVRRRDYAVNLMQTAAEALFFFHPGLWWVSARIREAREHCCDDVAVAACGEPAIYAEALAELASWRTREAALAIGAAGGSMLTRIQRVLRAEESDGSRTAGGFVMLGSLMAAVAGLAVLSASGTANAQNALQAPAEDRRVRSTDHFEIHFPPDLDLHAERVGQEAERAYETVSADLRHTLAFRVPIILFRTSREIEQSTRPGTVGPAHVTSGADPSRDRILFAVDRPVDEWSGLLTHEVAHVFGFDILPAATTPRWIAEGLAEYQRASWDPDDLAALREAVRANAIPKISQANEGRIAGDGRLLHAIGHAAFDFIESRWGEAGVRQFLFAVRRIGISGAGRYDGAFQIPADEFDRAFEEYLRERFSRIAERPPDARFDLAGSVRVEGDVSAIRSDVPPGLACLELWVAMEAERRQRWAVECGDAAARALLHSVEPGDRVTVTGAPAREPGMRRILMRGLKR